MNILRTCVIAMAAATPAIAEDDRTSRHSSPTTITILHTNDIHGRHVPFEAAPGDATSQTGDPGQSRAVRPGRYGWRIPVSGGESG